MRRFPAPAVSVLPLLMLLSACDAPSNADTDTDADTEGDTGSDAESGTGDPEELVEVEMDWLENVAQSWSGPVDPTPQGAIPVFPLAFEWEAQTLHAHTPIPNTEGYFDFRFRMEDGGWVLDEEGKLPTGLVQGYTLHPIDRDGDRIRWAYLGAPEYLHLDITVTSEQMIMEAWVLGEQHAVFDLTP